ncbi:hypothetical protein MDOR_31150 [Mycolicibacterium doricum]|uniref:Antitoxin n=1 Tax=Mycolicibacterium doricum TaxID=126673 RepID=A0A1X1SY61_9MYCO|nr:antitoxin [Mycolicibacterium doricum]MCV7268176.1 antitoxin [Mycolicibacterium doricum]ORV36196.1 hypothetical protein AWC01_17465 [Mycolicibacterium doricum]BBZ08946.1 hypothetical protein MDOR_31150 [Mycolicibacterium doricum]
MAFLDKVKNWVSKNPDKAGSAIEKAGDLFDQKTKGKYADKVNKAQGAAQNYVDKSDPQEQPPVSPPNPPLHP